MTALVLVCCWYLHSATVYHWNHRCLRDIIAVSFRPPWLGVWVALLRELVYTILLWDNYHLWLQLRYSQNKFGNWVEKPFKALGPQSLWALAIIWVYSYMHVAVIITTTLLLHFWWRSSSDFLSIFDVCVYEIAIANCINRRSYGPELCKLDHELRLLLFVCFNCS